MGFFARMFGPAAGTRISAVDYKARFIDGKQAHTLVDVRSPAEFASGYIPGAINVDVQDLPQKMTRIPKGKPVVLYCRSGSRSSHAAHILQDAGYSDIFDLGAVSGWGAAGGTLKRK